MPAASRLGDDDLQVFTGHNQRALSRHVQPLEQLRNALRQAQLLRGIERRVRLVVGLSRSALHERFVQYLGQPPMQYLASWRIQVGTRLLRESSRVVADIALEVGYDSEAAFARAFKRIVGMPPAAWRREQALSAKANST